MANIIKNIIGCRKATAYTYLFIVVKFSVNYKDKVFATEMFLKRVILF